MNAENITTKIAVFKGKKVRKTIHNHEWWFVINDVIESLTDSKDPAQYFKRLNREILNLPSLLIKGGYNLYHPLCWSSDAWVEKRVRGIAVREELTEEWQKRGIENQGEYAILTAEISKAAFGMTPSQYKKFKGLKRENLRDHMKVGLSPVLRAKISKNAAAKRSSPKKTI